MNAVIEHFKNKYRVGRYLIWLGIVVLMGAAFAASLKWLFHPAYWVLVVSSFALGYVMPAPKWARRPNQDQTQLVP